MREIAFAPGYFCDDAGEIYSARSNRTRGCAPPRRLSAKIERDGYMRVALSVDGKKRHFRVNRIVAQVYNGDPPTSKHVARHLNGNRLDNRAANVAWATQAENKADEVRHGTKLVGEKWPHATITERQALQIKSLIASGIGVVEVANRTGVNLRTVSQIRGNRQWKHVPWPDGYVNKPKPWRTLSPDRVNAIRSDLSNGNLQKKQIAAKWGVSETMVRGIGTGRYYSHVPSPTNSEGSCQ